MKCFYHSADLDGIASAAIVLYAEGDNVECIGIDYGDDFPWEKVAEGEKVYMVDFSLPPKDMLRLADMAHLVWIDHHKTAIDACYKENLHLMDGVREVGKAGCELTWEWLRVRLGILRMPHWIGLLGRYDVWDMTDDEKWHDEILPFQYGMRLTRVTPQWLASMWKDLNHFRVSEIIDQGKTVLKYQTWEDAKTAEQYSFPVELDKLPGIAVNSTRRSSSVLESIFDPSIHHFMSCFFLRPDRTWTVSLYTTRDDVDVSEIAKARGGGGHQKAAGFVCDKLPF